MKIVMTTGTFDLLHTGHVNLLKKAKEFGDYLVVGLNTDYVIHEAGKTPYYTYEQRKIVLESIKYVDKVVPLNKQEDKFTYLKDFSVDIFAIGSDYIGYKDIGDIEKFAKVRYIERTPDISTTQVKTYLSDTTKYHTFVIDIDDTISTTVNRDFENSKPITKVIDKVNLLHDKGWKIVLYTARGQKSCKTIEEMHEKYEGVTRKWLEKHGVKYDELLFGKPNADYYVDDKAMSISDFLSSDVF